MALMSGRERRRLPDWEDPSQCMYRRVAIDLERCDGCRLCTLVCPANVLEICGESGHRKARVKTDHRGCISCNNCAAICATGAIGATQANDFVGFYRQLGRGAFSAPRRF